MQISHWVEEENLEDFMKLVSGDWGFDKEIKFHTYFHNPKLMGRTFIQTLISYDQHKKLELYEGY